MMENICQSHTISLMYTTTIHHYHTYYVIVFVMLAGVIPGTNFLYSEIMR